MKTFKEYQEATAKTAIYPREDLILALCYCVLGLISEVGEVAGKLKKLIRDNKSIVDERFIEDMKSEIGDTYWYQSELATNLGLAMEDIAAGNIEKLEDRKARGVLKGSGDNR